MLKYEHGQKCFDDAIDVSYEDEIEVVELDLTETLYFFIFGEGLIEVKFEAQWNEDAGNHKISETDHACLEISLSIKIRENNFDGNVQIFGNCHHDICTIDPENIVEEESPQKEKAGFGGAEAQTFEGSKWEQYSKNVV